MSNTLATILDDSSNRALVREYLDKKWVERRDYDTKMANSMYAKPFRIPGNDGQYVTAYRKDFFRMPQKLSNTNQTADPASGADMGMTRVQLPMEYIQEYVPIGTIASWTSWADLEEWANEDLPLALRRRFHQLTQNAFRVGRYTPGVWGADGTASTAFDSTTQTTPTINGVSFTFSAAGQYFGGGKESAAALESGDIATWEDMEKMYVELSNAGAPKIGRFYVAVMSAAMISDLMKDDKYFTAAVQAWNGKGLRENTIVQYRGWDIQEDDEPFTASMASPTVRTTNGKLHTACCFGKNAFSYVQLGGKSKARPTFKVQDISKTGVEKTIGYLVPFQVGIVNSAWCAAYTAPVTYAQAAS